MCDTGKVRIGAMRGSRLDCGFPEIDGRHLELASSISAEWLP